MNWPWNNVDLFQILKDKIITHSATALLLLATSLIVFVMEGGSEFWLLDQTHLACYGFYNLLEMLEQKKEEKVGREMVRAAGWVERWRESGREGREGEGEGGRKRRRRNQKKRWWSWSKLTSSLDLLNSKFWAHSSLHQGLLTNPQEATTSLARTTVILFLCKSTHVADSNLSINRPLTFALGIRLMSNTAAPLGIEF